MHHLRSLGFDIRCNLHVPELADIKVATASSSRPTQEDVARGLHQALPYHHALAVVRYRRMPRIAFEHRGARLLDLEEQGIVGAASRSTTKQRVPTLPTPTTFIATSTTLNRSNRMRRSSARVSRYCLKKAAMTRSFSSRFIDVVEQRRLVDDARKTSDRGGNLFEDVFVGLLARFSNPLLDARPINSASLPTIAMHVFQSNSGVPRFEDAGIRTLSHRLPI